MNHSLTHLLTTSNQEMLAHLKSNIFFITVNAIERRTCEKFRIKVMARLKYSDLIVMEEQMGEENTMIAMVCTGLPSFCLSRQIWPPTIANL